MLVAVADFRAEYFTRRRNTHGRLLVEEVVDVPREPLGARADTAGSHDAADGDLGFGEDLRRIAFDERFWREVLQRSGVGTLGAELPRIAELDDVAVDRLAGALKVWARQIGAFQSNAKTSHVARRAARRCAAS